MDGDDTRGIRLWYADGTVLVVGGAEKERGMKGSKRGFDEMNKNL